MAAGCSYYSMASTVPVCSSQTQLGCSATAVARKAAWSTAARRVWHRRRAGRATRLHRHLRTHVGIHDVSARLAVPARPYAGARRVVCDQPARVDADSDGIQRDVTAPVAGSATIWHNSQSSGADATCHRPGRRFHDCDRVEWLPRPRVSLRLGGGHGAVRHRYAGCDGPSRWQRWQLR